MSSEHLNIGDFVSELAGAIYGQNLWPGLEICRTRVENLKDRKVMVAIFCSDCSDSEKLKIEQIVLDLRDDYSKIVESVILRSKSVTVMCRESFNVPV